MRLVFVNRFFYPDHSATSQILSDLCFALAARGHEVHVVTSRLRYDDPSDRLAGEDTLQVVREAHAMESAVVHVHRVWTSRFGRGALLGRAMDYFTFYLSALWRLVRLADRSVAKPLPSTPLQKMAISPKTPLVRTTPPSRPRMRPKPTT